MNSSVWCAIRSAATMIVGVAGMAAAESGTASRAFLEAPQLVTQAPDAQHRATTRRFQGIPSLARTPGGRLWAVWYGGPGGGEDHTNYIVAVTSGDDGRTWSDEAIVVDPDGLGPVRAFDPELWVDPTGRLWLSWAQAMGHDASVGGVWAITTRNGDDAKPTWTPPRRITDGVMMCKPRVLSTGEWVWPVSTWRATDGSAKMIVSTDRGETWTVRGGANVQPALRDFDEHHILERRDGSLWMLVRLATDTTKSTPPQFCIGESVSADRGKTWSPIVARGSLPHIRSRFFVERLASGRLLLVKHRDDTLKRDHLTAYLSDDDGRTWSGGLALEERACSYPDGVQAKDGRIFVIYDRNRAKEGFIEMAVFTEQDVAAGRIVSAEARLRVPIARLPERMEGKK